MRTGDFLLVGVMVRRGVDAKTMRGADGVAPFEILGRLA